MHGISYPSVVRLRVYRFSLVLKIVHAHSMIMIYVKKMILSFFLN